MSFTGSGNTRTRNSNKLLAEGACCTQVLTGEGCLCGMAAVQVTGCTAEHQKLEYVYGGPRFFEVDDLEIVTLQLLFKNEFGGCLEEEHMLRSTNVRGWRRRK